MWNDWLPEPLATQVRTGMCLFEWQRPDLRASRVPLICIDAHNHSSLPWNTEEPKRFLALIDALEARWKEDKATKSILDAATGTLPYIPLVRA
jgi:hypothetical protein